VVPAGMLHNSFGPWCPNLSPGVGHAAQACQGKTGEGWRGPRTHVPDALCWRSFTTPKHAARAPSTARIVKKRMRHCDMATDRVCHCSADLGLVCLSSDAEVSVCAVASATANTRWQVAWPSLKARARRIVHCYVCYVGVDSSPY